MIRPPERGWTWRRDSQGRAEQVIHHGHAGRIEVLGPAGGALPWAAFLAAARSAAEAGAPSGSTVRIGAEDHRAWKTPAGRPPLSGAPIRRVLFFESLMNAEMPHNDGELSQGVLHMVSALRGMPVEVVLANVKMAIVGVDRPVEGLDSLEAALAGPPIELVCITLLEGYWEGVISLVRAVRELGCRAHIAVGGVMPSLAPDAVAAHLPDVTFVCRGAGEVFLPKLAAILGEGANIDTPLSEAQVGALLPLDGLYVRDAAGNRLIAANTAAVVEVADLDATPLDLRFLQARHFATGVEIASSRGCIHRCVFCSILGRERYQARSAPGILALLEAYDARLHEVFGADVPRTARRVHFSDDDFACDRDRARDVFRGIPHTPFRLASVQVSIADLCLKEQGTPLPSPDAELLNSIRPECFDDASRPIATADFIADHRSRRWSSYLQVGVESFSDTELVRLGKGYRREHVRAIVADLARRELHHDAYFILCNRQTTFADLIEVLDEVVRQKTLHPRFFHIRFPVVPRLVSYATSASWRRLVRQGDNEAFSLRDTLTQPEYPDYDYPLVDHDVPRDTHVRDFVDASLFTDDDLYAGTYTRLRERLVARWAATPDPDTEFAARMVDDRPRRRLFELLDLARRAGHREGWGPPEGEPAPHPARLQATPAMRDAVTGQADRLRDLCDTRFGPTKGWLPAFQRYAMGGTTRLVVIPTWQCELRCNYCYIPKQDGRVMTAATMNRAIDLLCSSERRDLTLQFFGGEALMEWGLVQHAIEAGAKRATQHGKHLDFVLSSNGWTLDEAKLDWLRDRSVRLELSMDGDPETQRRFRPAAKAGQDSYENGIGPRVAAIVASGIPYDVIMVVHPELVGRLAHNYQHIAELGFQRVQINFALGKTWSSEQRKRLAEELFSLSNFLMARPDITLVNAENTPMPMRLNAEITVDWDGTVYGGNAFLHETEHKDRFRRGHLDDLGNFDRYWMDAPSNAELVDWSYGKVVTANNLAVGAVMTDFLKWWRAHRAAH